LNIDGFRALRTRERALPGGTPDGRIVRDAGLGIGWTTEQFPGLGLVAGVGSVLVVELAGDLSRP